MRKLWNFLNSPFFDIIVGLCVYFSLPFFFNYESIDFTSCLFAIFLYYAVDSCFNGMRVLFVRSRRGRGGNPLVPPKKGFSDEISS